jgi:HAD superfamily hydrolase (TIGR01509 family)
VTNTNITNIVAVVFDFDGLVLDTETPVYEAWSAVFDAHGCGPLTIEEWSAEVGTDGVLDLVAMMQTRATRTVDVDAMHAARRAHRDGLLERETLMPGVEQWLDDARDAGFGIAIASSSEHEWVHGHLTRLGVRDRFGHLSCRDEVVPGKPAPDVYLRACEALGVEPVNAVAVEDSPNGVTAAKAAGLWCVAVPNRITETLDFSAADLVVESLAAVTLADALERLDRLAAGSTG